MDVLASGIEEIIGGSQREERLEAARSCGSYSSRSPRRSVIVDCPVAATRTRYAQREFFRV
jgi:hypothetical protein